MFFELLSLFLFIIVVALLRSYLSEKKRNAELNLQYNIFVAQSLGHAATLRDYDTGVHNFRVSYLSSIFGTKLGLDNQQLRNLMKGAFLHDVGKIGIPDAILLKNGPLSDEEWKVMKTHTTLGVELVKHMAWFKDAQDVILYHHEKYDGSGYPSGLKDENIPYIARIFSFIDVFDALVSQRPYKKAFSVEETIKIIQQNTPTQFDPKLSKLFVAFVEDLDMSIYTKSEVQVKDMLIQRRKLIFKM